MRKRVLDSLARDGGNYVCAECGFSLGPETGDYRTIALAFDEPITAGEPPELAAVSNDYILRHYCCPGCATLFEVEMLPIGATPRPSMKLAAMMGATDSGAVLSGTAPLAEDEVVRLQLSVRG